MFTEVTKAEYIGNYKVSVLFNDGVTKIIDFYSILFLHDYPAFITLKDIEVFKKFKVTDTLEWDNGNIDIAPETLYEMGETVNANPIEYSI
ncbi:MAG: DUF2442 domain-containing protein [Paludibacter sp.]|nr:DUF2442 domain-containing protein [Paludibacter sp.]